MGPVNQTANPQQQSFALAQLQRLFGQMPQVNSLAPTSGPYNWPAQAEVGGARTALDGSVLGGINLGYVDSIYGQNPDQASGDARIREIFGPMFGGAGAGQPAAPPMVNPQPSMQMPLAPAAAAPSAGMNPGAQGSLPLSFSEDLTGQKMGAAPQQQAPMQQPQGSAFAPSQGQNQNTGIAQLNQIYEWLRSQGVQL